MRVWIVAGVALSLLAGCAEPAPDAVPTQAAAGVVTQVIELGRDDTQQAWDRVTADVVARNDSMLLAEVSARVLNVSADVGQSVAKGELLITLDPADLALALLQAQAQLAAAQARLELARERERRASALSVDGYISQDDLLARRAELRLAQAELRVQQAARDVTARQLAKAQLRAPFDGVVLERLAQVGAAVAPGTPLLRLIDAAAPEVEARLLPAQLQSLEASAEVAFEALGTRHPLVLLRAATVLDQRSRTQVVRLGFDAEPATAGSSGTLLWRARGFRIEAAWLLQRDERLGVFTVDQGLARFVALPQATLGRSTIADLPAQTVIVTRGQNALADGDPVAAARGPAP